MPEACRTRMLGACRTRERAEEQDGVVSVSEHVRSQIRKASEKASDQTKKVSETRKAASDGVRGWWVGVSVQFLVTR